MAARCEKAVRAEADGGVIPASAGSPPPSQLFYAAMGFSRRRVSTGGFRRRAQGFGWRAPRLIGRFRSLGAGRFLLRPPSMAGMGWLGATSRKERPDAVRRGLQGVVIATARASAAGAVRQRTAVSGKEPELLARFSRKGPWVPKNKKPTSGWKWASDAFARRSSVYPLPVRGGGAFRRSYLVDLPGGDGLQAHEGSRATHMGGRSGHGVQRAVHGIGYCGKCASDVWTLTLIGTSPFFFKGCAKVFFAWAILAAEQRGKPEGTTEGNEGNKGPMDRELRERPLAVLAGLMGFRLPASERPGRASFRIFLRSLRYLLSLPRPLTSGGRAGLRRCRRWRGAARRRPRRADARCARGRA